MNQDEDRTIGQRLRMIRKRRGLSLDVVAGQVGKSKQFLSMAERGLRGFNRRGLLEDFATVIGCSVADLTGQPYLFPDRESGRATLVIRQIEYGLNEATLDDVPDLRPQPLETLTDWMGSGSALRDTAQYRPSGEGIDTALVDLQVHVATSSGRERHQAAALLVEAAYHAFVLATTFGYLHLAQLAARRAFDAARIAERSELAAFAMFARVPSVARTGGRNRAVRMLDRAMIDAQPLTAIRDGETLGAETCGLLHLMGAHLAARDNDPDTAGTHLGEASRIAALTGERNGLRQHFGPTNVQCGGSLSARNSGRVQPSPNASHGSRSTWTSSAATIASQPCTSIWHVPGRRPKVSAMPRRSGTWTAPTGWRRNDSATIRSPGIWC